MKRFIYVITLFCAITNITNAQEKIAHLNCKMENGNEWLIKVDLIENNLQMYPLDKFKIQISENEITHDIRIQEKLMASIRIDRFSLRISMFSALLKTDKDTGWTYGKCELAKKLF